MVVAERLSILKTFHLNRIARLTELPSNLRASASWAEIKNVKVVGP